MSVFVRVSVAAPVLGFVLKVAGAKHGVRIPGFSDGPL
jgi:hypothetical protein